MRWNTKPPYKSSKTRKWFAWYPVKLSDPLGAGFHADIYVWLEFVHRRTVYFCSWNKNSFTQFLSSPKEQVDFSPGE